MNPPHRSATLMSVQMRQFDLFEVFPAYDRQNQFHEMHNEAQYVPWILYIICRDPSGLRCLRRLKIKSMYAMNIRLVETVSQWIRFV